MKTLGFKKMSLYLIFTMSLVLFGCPCGIIDDDPEPPLKDFGTVLWEYSDFNVYPEATDPVSITSPAIGSDGTIYVAAHRVVGTWLAAKLHAINPDGTFKWASPDLLEPWPSDPVIGKDGTIYVITNFTVHAINPSDGSIKWTYKPSPDENERYALAWLTIGNNDEIFFANAGSGTYLRKLFAINNKGDLIWKRKMVDGDDWFVSTNIRSMVVGVDGTLFTYWDPLHDGHIMAMNPANGKTIWDINIEGGLDAQDNMAISPNGDLVFTQLGPNKLIKMDATNGDIIWQVDSPEGWPSISPDGSIYLMSNNLYCYDSQGTLKWQKGNGPVENAGNTTIDSDGKTYVNTNVSGPDNFKVYYPDGSLKYSVDQDMDRSVAIGSNKVIYICSSWPSTIYAMQGDKSLASSGWPRNTGGNKNSRNVNQK